MADANMKWTVTCKCGKSVLKCHGPQVQVAFCHCVDCRKANGGKDVETLLLYRRDQIELPEDESVLELVPNSEFKYNVPRYICKTCRSYLLADVSLCPPAKGYPMGESRDRGDSVC